MFYLDLLPCLNAHRVRYLLADGLAMNLVGVPRLTTDVDSVVALDEANLEACLASTREPGLKPSVPVAIESLKGPVMRRDRLRRGTTIV